MTEIKSQEVVVNARPQEVFEYLQDLNNLVNLLPQDKISEWQGSVDECSFKIQGAATIDLKKQSVQPPFLINLSSGPKAPFSFTLDIKISDDAGERSKGFIHFQGNMNPFLKMMAEKPLTNLFNYMSNKLKEVMD